MLFTITAVFSDFTTAYEQSPATSPGEALENFLVTAEALSPYDRADRESIVTARRFMVVHLAGGLRGLWSWHLTRDLDHDDVRLYGGVIVQTDPEAPLRPEQSDGDA